MKVDEKKCSVIILAAGKGKRMRSDIAKVLHRICGRPMLSYSIDVARSINAEKIVVVVGHQGRMIRDIFSCQELIYVEQSEQLGTGHAVFQAKEVFSKYSGNIVILCADVPLLKVTTVQSLIEQHMSKKAFVTVLTTVMKNPAGYGRIVKNAKNGGVSKIVEDRDATSEEKAIKEINTGIYCVDSRFLFEAVSEISSDNAQKEYYLTDMIQIANRKGLKIISVTAPDSLEVMGINTPAELKIASALRKKLQETCSNSK